MDEAGRFVKAATVGDPASARLCAALLDSAGIPTRIHGESMGPYVMTVGQMAVTEIWVPRGELEDAIEVMLAAEIDGTLVVGDEAGSEPPPPMRLLALVVAVVFAAAVVAALLRVF